MGRCPAFGQIQEVTIFYTAPTIASTFIRWGDEHPGTPDAALEVLCLLGIVGEHQSFPEAMVAVGQPRFQTGVSAVPNR